MRKRRAAEVRATLRQWRWPREFRIRPAPWPDDILSAFAGLSAPDAVRLDEPGQAPGPRAAASGDVPGLSGRSLADVATSVWRLRVRMAGLPEGMRSTTRHVEKAWDTLAEAGVEIKDHLNAPFDSGLSISVVAFQPTPGLERERVIETIRPSVYLGDQRIQMAEVIVGTPDSTDGTRPRPGAREQRQ
ncbi:hypothetical protein [Actinomadura rubrisoli]|uniref:Uncharacterized protein n=1 Tax=Actinomadura rubrisoli TaxID=2530368 RepID=A0A4R5C4I7_9ACTN|nr:hypothetical protein [Actinomadura rubrisoli]TDD93519.1 hypothetical protein E1298_09335 [Actinomadura rubrisoli]